MSNKEDVFCIDCKFIGFAEKGMDIEDITCIVNSKWIKNAIKESKIFCRCVDINKNNNCEDYEKCALIDEQSGREIC